MRANAEIRSIKTSTLPQSILEQLVEAIMSGKLKPGSRLNESELSRQLEVSRAPIREALNQLQEQGMVVYHPRRGMFVVSLIEDDIHKINQLRVLLEAEALILCRKNLSAQIEKKILAMVDKMENGISSRLEAVRVDLAFHRLIWAQGGNEYLERILTSLTAPLFAYALITKTFEPHQTFLDSHRPIVDFILGKNRDERAKHIMIDHVNLRWKLPNGGKLLP